jgi:hypothetical protein
MSDKTATSATTMIGRLGLTQKQAGLIGVLSVVLVGTLYVSNDGTAASKGNTEVPTAADSQARATRRNAASPVSVVAGVRWPEVSLEQAVSHNPFAPPQKLTSRWNPLPHLRPSNRSQLSPSPPWPVRNPGNRKPHTLKPGESKKRLESKTNGATRPKP